MKGNKMKKQIVELRDVRYSIRDGNLNKEVLKGINIDFNRSEIITVSGPSGSGKTTLLYAIAGLLDSVKGHIRIEGKDIQQMSKKEKTQFRLENISMIFQSLNLFSFMNVRDNILLPYYIKDRVINDEILELMRRSLKEMQLDGEEDRQITSLSGGERQRVAIVRAIVDNPKIILCDEPTASLDKENTHIFMQMLKNIQKKNESTFIIATHDPYVVEYGDTKLYMDDGMLQLAGDYKKE